MELNGLELRRIESQMRDRIRQRRMDSMTNLDGLTRSSIEARIEYLINQRVTENGESRQYAEISVTRTTEGRALWNKARKLRMAESADSAPASSFSKNAASGIGPQAQLENLIAQRMSDCGESFAKAENAVIHTSDGLALWERLRTLRLADSRE